MLLGTRMRPLMLRRALGGLVVFVVVLLGAPRARAQVKGAPRLEFSAPPGCPNEATFRNDVAIFFGGQDPFNPTAPDVVRVTFTKIPGGYRGTVQYTPPKGDPWPAQSSTGAPWYRESFAAVTPPPSTCSRVKP